MTRLYTSGLETGLKEEFSLPGGATIISDAAVSRGYSTYAMRLSGSETKQVIPAGKTELYVRFFTHLSTSVAKSRHFQIEDPSGNVLIGLDWGSNGTDVIDAYVGAGSVASSGSALSSAVYRFDIYYKMADSGGRIVVKIDGTTYIDYTGDTNPGVATEIGFIGFLVGTGTIDIDDIAINDPSGSVDNTYIGDGYVRGSLMTPGEANQALVADPTVPNGLRFQTLDLDFLADVDVSAAEEGDFLGFSDGMWFPIPVPGGSSGIPHLTPSDLVIRRRLFYQKLTTDTDSFDVDLVALDALGYDRIIIKAGLRSSVNANNDVAYLFLNGDFTVGNYRHAEHYGGTSSSGGANSTPAFSWTTGLTSPTGSFAESYGEIQAASDTSNLKQLQILIQHERDDNSTVYTGHFGYTHRGDVNAVNRLTLRLDGYPTDVFKAGSWFEVIGERNESIRLIAGSPEVIGDLLDVDMTVPPADGDILLFDDTSSQWKPTAPTGTVVSKKTFREKELITSYTFGAPAGMTPTFTLPQNYDEIYIEADLRSDGATTHSRLQAIINGDTTTSNYWWQYLYASTATGYQQTNARYIGGYIFANTPVPLIFSRIELELISYSDSVRHKHIWGHTGGHSSGNYEAVGITSTIWKNTNPITTIAFDLEGGYNFIVGSQIRIYGVKDREVVVDGRAPDTSPTPPKKGVTFEIAGTLTVQAKPARVYNVWGQDYTIEKVHLAVNTAPTGTSLLVDVNKNGSTIFSNQSHRPAIAASSNTGETTTIDISSLAEGDYLQIDVDQVGSPVAGANLLVQVVIN